MKFQNVEDKEKILKASRGKEPVAYKRIENQNDIKYSAVALEVERQCFLNYRKVLFNLGLYAQTIKCKGRIKTFLDM